MGTFPTEAIAVTDKDQGVEEAWLLSGSAMTKSPSSMMWYFHQLVRKAFIIS
jgi:hypothetical protein